MTATAPDPSPAPAPGPAGAPDLLPATARALDGVLAREQVSSRLPSVVAGVVRGGRLVWTGAAGATTAADGGGPAAGPGTQYRIGSITKTFVAAGVVRARDDGLLALEDPVRAHLPELDAAGVGGRTVGHLLAQSAGVQAETDGPWWERTPGGGWEELAPSLGAGALRHRAGTRFHYSNVGFGVLGELLGRVRGATWSQVVDEQFLRPLGMDRTTPRPRHPHAQGLAVHPWADVVLPEPEHDAGAMAPAGQLWSTVEDLARWAGVLAGRTDVLAAASVAEMSRPHAVDDLRGAGWSSGYGLGLQVWSDGARRWAGHSGSMPGFVALLRVDPATGEGLVALTNSTTGFGDLARSLQEVLDRLEPALPAPWAPAAVPADVLELVGPWYWGPAALAVRARGDGGFELAALQGRARASRFAREQDGWVGLDGYYAGERLRVVRAADGSVGHLDLASFRLTRAPYDPDGDVPGGVDPGGWRPGGGPRSGT
ncbi:serine hydrolase domain-containing protein [Kineococcus terrestris]|uniref:serine hydrolase domain-containing protein n=1 Tax=Kineococcus terrestris TaxID=2044856 RepID=UPI0034DB1A06